MKIFLIPFFLISTLFSSGCYDSCKTSTDNQAQNTVLCEESNISYKDLTEIAYRIKILNNRCQMDIVNEINFAPDENKIIFTPDNNDFTIAMLADSSTPFIIIPVEDLISVVADIILKYENKIEYRDLYKIYNNFQNNLKRINSIAIQANVNKFKANFVKANFDGPVQEKDTLDGCIFFTPKKISSYPKKDSIPAYTLVQPDGSITTEYTYIIDSTYVFKKNENKKIENKVYIPSDIYAQYVASKISIPNAFYHKLIEISK